MYLFIGLFAGAILVGILVRKATAPKPQSIGIAGPMAAGESTPEA